MSHMYEIARQLQAPGVQTTATFNPARLTKTLRNMVRKSIATGNHNGGWTSKTKDVRELVFSLAGELPIVYVSQHTDYMSFHIPRPITSNVQAEIMGLLEADCALQKMGWDNLGDSKYRPTREQHNATITHRFNEHVAKLVFAEKGKARNLIVRTPKIRQQMADVFLKERTVEEIAIAERIAKYLDADIEYNVPTTHKF